MLYSAWLSNGAFQPSGTVRYGTVRYGMVRYGAVRAKVFRVSPAKSWAGSGIKRAELSLALLIFRYSSAGVPSALQGCRKGEAKHTVH